LFSSLRPWDNQIDQFQYENNFKINTKTVQKLKREKRQSLNRHDSIFNLNENEKITNDEELRININQIKIEFDSIQNRLEHIENKIEKLSNIINNKTYANDMNNQSNILKLICLVAFMAWLLGNLCGYVKL
jgi:Mg2+ and Co2+ transporter CorA